MGAEGPVPGHLRCRRSDGKQWQCSRRAEDGKSFCEFHHLQALRRQSRRARQAVPEHLRCRRSDGKQWRCSRRAKNGLSFCEIHHLQALRRQSRQPVPDSLKLPCLRRGADSAAQKDGELGSKDAPVTMPKRGRKKVGNGELTMELIRMVVRQMLRRREEKEKRKREETTMDDTYDLRGEVADDVASSSHIAPIMSPDIVGGDPAEGKLVLGTSSFLRWPFRSKNVERPPLVASAQVWLPVRCSTMISRGRRTIHGEKSRKRACQLCQETHTQSLVRCSSCRKVLFCMTCVKKWYPGVSEREAKVACPICHGMRASRT